MAERGTFSVMIVGWWYGENFVRVLRYIKKLFLALFDLFSVAACVKTLLSVWRRDLASYENLSLQEKFQAALLNLASRLIGFLIKLFTLVAYLFTTSLFSIIAFISIIVFLLWPIEIVGLIILGFIKILGA